MDSPARAAGPPTLPLSLAGLAAMLRAVTGEGEEWARAVTPLSRLEGDLALDSLELAALGELLRSSYGPAVSLPGYLANLELDQLIGLTVGDLLAYLAEHASPGAAGVTAG